VFSADESEHSISYLGQRLMLPMMLSEHQDTTLACLVATLPSAVFVLAYHVILKPRRRKQRAESVVYHHFSCCVNNLDRFYRLARKELLEEKSNIHREIEETTLLLKETARKHTHAETSKEGMSPRLTVRVAELN